ncbi:hypothetical protein D6C83_07810, partial [Aureobasidium pullulans]
SSIEQNELLEAILDADADKLKRPAEVSHIAKDTNMENRAQSSAVRQGSQSPSVRRQSRRIATEAPSATPESATPEVSQQEPTTTKRRGRKPLTQTKFKGFDEIDINALPKYRSPSPSQPPSYDASQIPSPDAMDDDSHRASSHPVPSQHTQRSTRKRPPPEDEETHQDMMTDMLQGAAKMKRRRIEQGLETSTTSAETPVEAPTPAPAIVKAKKRKDKEVDVRAILAERQQAEEERRLEDEEKLRNQLAGMEVADMKNLAQIEEMEIRRGPPPRSRHDAEAGHDDRWDDRWNGRKNFKKFRRQGNAGNTQTRARVFVSLEEVAPKAYGAQDDYFLESSSIRSKKAQKKAKRSQQTQDSVDVQVTATPASTSGKGTQSQRQKNNTNSISLVSDSDNDKSSEDEDNASRFRRRIATSRRQDAEASRSEAIMPEEIAGTARDQDIADAARQAKSSASVRTQPGKRTAKGVVDEVSQPRKRVQRKPSPDEVSEDEDDEEVEEEEEEEEEEQIEIVEYSVTVEASPVNATVETRTAEIELPRFMFMLTVDMETTVEAGSVMVQVDRGQVCEHLVVTVKVAAAAVLTSTDRGQDLTAQVREHCAITVGVSIEVTVDLAQEITLHPVGVVVLVLILIGD